MSIILFSGQDQPYGLLSNNAIVPMIIDGKNYNSVTEYVYMNLFTTAPEISAMSEHINRKPYSAALAIKSGVTSNVFIEAILAGTKAKFIQDPLFKAGINALGDAEISISWGTEEENRRLRTLYYQLRFSPYQIFFDEKYGEVPFDVVNSVVSGVADALLINPHLPSMPFSELLLKYKKTAPLNRDLLSIIDSLDEIVPILKIKLKDKIYAEEILRFQKHLLDVTLNYILRTRYKHIDPSKYYLAKQQQLFKEYNRISQYETSLFNLYKSGNLPQDILDNLEFISTAPLSSNLTIDSIEEQTIEDTPIENLQSLHHMKLLNDPIAYYQRQIHQIPDHLLPHAPTNIKINGINYTSVVTYAYSVLFNHIGLTASSDVLANSSLDKLKNDYIIEEHNVLAHRLTELNEKATRTKFATDSSLVQLLLATDNSDLIFADIDDQILGIAKPSVGNRAGVFLRFLREEYATKPPISVSFKTPYDNIVVTKWFASRALDYANTLTMFRVRTAEDIALIYNIKPEFVSDITDKSSELMNASGLTSIDQKLVMPFMVADFFRIKLGGVKAICKLFTHQQPSKDDKIQAENILASMYQEVKHNLWENIDRRQFIAMILSNRQDHAVKQEQWWRIMKWARIGRLRAGINDPLQTLDTIPMVQSIKNAPNVDKELTLSAVPMVKNIKTPNIYGKELNILAKYLGIPTATSLKQLLPQVVALSGGEYNKIYPPKNYWLTDKADGVRALAIAKDGRLVVLTSEAHEYRSNDKSRLTIVDGELVPEGDINIFYGFDVLTYAGENLTQIGFENRIKNLANAVNIISKFIPARLKLYVELGDDMKQLQMNFDQIYKRKRPYKTDGLILVEPAKQYNRTVSYKWKPIEDITIDFLAKKAPPEYLSTWTNYRLYLLFVGISNNLFKSTNMVRCNGYNQLFLERDYTNEYFPIQFQPANMPYAYLYHHPIDSPDIDGQIVELSFIAGVKDKLYGLLPRWKMVRIRTDRIIDLKTRKYFGNDFRIAELTWLNYVDPFPYEDLITGHNDSYFKSDNLKYKDQTAYTSYIKNNLINQFTTNVEWVVDLGIGKGQDLGRYMLAHVHNLVGVDKDRAALAELIRRKYSHLQIHKGNNISTALHIVRQDISKTPVNELVNKIHAVGLPTTGSDAVVCNLAVHYFVETQKTQHNFALLCMKLVKPGGCIILTYMDGERVFNLLANLKSGNRWEMKESEHVKYAITREYTETTIAPAGQKIKVLLPFSDNTMYEEFLVNTEALISVFKNYGFTVKETYPFLKNLTKYKNINGKKMWLSKADIAWLNLYSALVFIRNK